MISNNTSKRALQNVRQIFLQQHSRSATPLSMRAFSASTTSPPSLQNIGVAGLGLMGHGICQVAAASGIHPKVVAYEPKQKFLEAGKSRIESSISKLVAKEKLTQQAADETMARIHFTTDPSDLANVDMVVEAVVENMFLKRSLYQTLAEVCAPHTIFASNTSSLSITEMAQVSDRPEKFVGVHFFNPVQMMQLVEVIRTEQTSPDVFREVYDWVGRINKVAVSCGDTPGFIVNRLLIPSLIQAMCMLDRGDATIRDIDVSMQLGAGHPMGPLHLADYVGLDTCLFIMQGWTEKYPNEPTFIIPKCLQEKVAAGHLGSKSGKGFYDWDGSRRGDPVQ